MEESKVLRMEDAADAVIQETGMLRKCVRAGLDTNKFFSCSDKGDGCNKMVIETEDMWS